MHGPSVRNILDSESEGPDQVVSWMGSLKCPSCPKLRPKVKQSSISPKSFFHCLELPSGGIQLGKVNRAGMGDTGRGT